MRRGAGLLVTLALACAPGTPSPHAEPRAGEGVWGYVRLLPREGVKPAGGGGGGSYGDRRLADVELVDYERPGFAVVYAEGRPAPADALALAVREGVASPQLEPALGAVAAGGRISVRNETRAPHTLSLPAAGAIHRLAPGASVEIAAGEGGEQALFLLDAPRAEARVFVAPGPYAVASELGRFELPGLGAGGRVRLVAWHPRFPPAARWVELAGGSQRVDLELQVGREEEPQ
jgi:hypothetical protein